MRPTREWMGEHGIARIERTERDFLFRDAPDPGDPMVCFQLVTEDGLTARKWERRAVLEAGGDAFEAMCWERVLNTIYDMRKEARRGPD